MARVFTWLLASLVATSGCPGSSTAPDDDDSDPCEEHTWFRDADGDSWGDADEPLASCEQPSWYVAAGGDCDDEDGAIHPDADEVCDGADNDCDGEVDEGFELQTWYQDLDGDGYGNSLVVVQARCEAPDGYVDIGGDCDDTEPDAHPTLTEVLCDGIDNDCDGVGGGEVAAVLNGDEHATIADAMLNAAFGETVHICPGEHTEALTIGADDEMTLTAYSGSAEDTVLDGEGARVILSIGLEAQVTLTDLTFRNGNARQDAEQDGGAVFSYGSSLTLQRCRFEENCAAEEGGAVYSIAWDDTYDVETLVESCTFTGNSAGTEGGAVETSAWTVTTLTVTDSIFEGNESDAGGGVISADGHGSAFVYVSNSEFTGNRANGSGGVISIGPWQEGGGRTYRIASSPATWDRTVAVSSIGEATEPRTTPYSTSRPRTARTGSAPLPRSPVWETERVADRSEGSPQTHTSTPSPVSDFENPTSESDGHHLQSWLGKIPTCCRDGQHLQSWLVKTPTCCRDGQHLQS